jgi:hypothetical protein
MRMMRADAAQAGLVHGLCETPRRCVVVAGRFDLGVAVRLTLASVPSKSLGSSSRTL